MITLYRRGRAFWADATINGVRRRWSLKTRDRVVAEALKRKHELELLGGSSLVAKRIEDFASEFLTAAKQDAGSKTLREYGLVINAFSAFLKKEGIDELRQADPAAVNRFTEWRRGQIHRINKRPKTEGGIKYDLRVLHRFFNYAIECRYIERNPVLAKNRNAEGGKTKPFSTKEVETMLGAPYLQDKQYLRAIVILFLCTGLRIGDVIRLQRAAVSTDFSVLKTKKRKVDVGLQVHPDLRAALESHFAAQTSKQKSSTYLFSTDTGLPIVSLDKHLRRLWKACEIVGGHAHRFRDTFAVRLLENGASLYDVAKLLGISIATAEKHYAPYTKELQERGAKLIQSLKFPV